MSELSFTAFVISLASSAAIHFGDMPDPESGERQPEANLEGAHQMIDILSLLEEKTRGNLSAEMQEQQVTAERAAGGRVDVDEEHQIWPFNGEYWRDELGFYRQTITSKCGR